MSKRIIGLDCETVDNLLKEAGWSWKYNQGYVLCTALYFAETDEIKVIAGKHNDNCPYPFDTRADENEEIEGLLLNPEVCIVGANILYDLGWLLYEYKMSVYDVKCSFVDVLQAESILDEFSLHSLDTLSYKYLHYGKNKAEIENWIFANIPKAKGDFRKYLGYAPYNLLCDYVQIDAKNPVKIWEKQLVSLKRQDLCKRAKLEFDCILPTLQMTIEGIPFNNEMRKKNLAELVAIRDSLKEDFQKQYNMPSFKIGSSKQIAALLDKLSIPYFYCITLTGVNGVKFASPTEKDRAFNDAKRIVATFRLKKGDPVAYVPSELAERTEKLLAENGFMFNSSPHLDKTYFASQRNNYEIIALLADWKQAESIISKILGDAFERFICPDGKIRPQFKITDTISFRYSSNKPNCQQLPSKNELKGFSFPKKIRSLIYAPEGCVFGKIDYGQIEYRLICNAACGKAGEEVRAEYEKNPHLDFHQYVVDLTGLSRKYAKNMSFGVSFGMGLKSMAETFGWTQEQAEEISEQYHAKMPFVKPTLELVGEVAKKRGYIKTVYGSHARLPDKGKAYTMLNRYTQGSGAECLKLSIVQAYNEGLWKKLRPANTIHDELNFPYLEPTEECMKNFYRMAEIMRTAMPSLRVPLEAEIELGEDWSNTKEIKDWLEIRENDKEKWDSLSPALRKAVEICEEIKNETERV